MFTRPAWAPACFLPSARSSTSRGRAGRQRGPRARRAVGGRGSRSPAAELLPAPTAPPSAPSAAGQRHLSSLSARVCQLPASVVEPDVLTSGGGGCPKGVAVQTLVGLAKVVVSEGRVPACSQKWWSLTARKFGQPPPPENHPPPHSHLSRTPGYP